MRLPKAGYCALRKPSGQATTYPLFANPYLEEDA